MTKLFRTTITGLGLAVGIVAAGSTATAGFNATFNGANPDATVSFSARGVVKTNQPAGRMEWTTTNTISSGLANLNGQMGNKFISFCIEVTQNVSTNTVYTFNAQSLTLLPTSGAGQPMTPVKANDLAQFWNQWQPVITALQTAAGNITIGLGTFTKDVMGAALQVAIWEIVYEKSGTEGSDGSGYDVYAENGGLNQGFRLTQSSTVGNVANYLLNKNNTNFETGSLANLVGFAVTKKSDGSYAQDQITVEGDGFDNLEPVPAPPALVLALVGIVPCLAMRRRLRAQAA